MICGNDLWKPYIECGNNYVKYKHCEMSQVRRKSTGNKGNTTQVLSKDQDSDIGNLEEKVASTSAKSTKATGVSQQTD